MTGFLRFHERSYHLQTTDEEFQTLDVIHLLPINFPFHPKSPDCLYTGYLHLSQDRLAMPLCLPAWYPWKHWAHWEKHKEAKTVTVITTPKLPQLLCDLPTLLCFFYASVFKLHFKKNTYLEKQSFGWLQPDLKTLFSIWKKKYFYPNTCLRQQNKHSLLKSHQKTKKEHLIEFW